MYILLKNSLEYISPTITVKALSNVLIFLVGSANRSMGLIYNALSTGHSHSVIVTMKTL